MNTNKENGLLKPSSLNVGKNNPRIKNNFNMVYSNHLNELGYTINYNTRQKHNYNMLYSNHLNKLEYTFEYSYRRALNYLFEYIMYPRYGRYTFIYDITDKIVVEDNVVCLEKADKNISKDNVHIGVNGDYKINSIFNDMTNRLSNIGKTIDEYVDYTKLYSSTGGDRHMKLLSDYNPMDNTSSKNRTMDNTLYDFIIDRVIEDNRNIEISQEHELGKNVIRDIDVELYLKSDTILRDISEKICLKNISEMYLKQEDRNINVITSDIELDNHMKDLFLSDNRLNLANAHISTFNSDDKESMLHDYDKNISINNDHIHSNKVEHDVMYDYEIVETSKTWKDVSNHSDIEKINKLPKDGVDTEEESMIHNFIKAPIKEVNNNNYNDVFTEKSPSRETNLEDIYSIDKAPSRDIYTNDIVSVEKTDSREYKLEDELHANKTQSNTIHTNNDTSVTKDIVNSIQNTNNDILMYKEHTKTLEQEFEERLDLHKRFWFIKSIGKIDYKIVPNTDFSYPADINIFVEKPDYVYLFDFDCEYQDITSDKLVIELYDYQYKQYEEFTINSIQNGTYANNNISVEIETNGNKARYKIKINHQDLYYIIIRQPLDVNGYPVLYTATKKFLGENTHPIPFGSDMGILEIPVHISIMVEFINILMLMWSKFYYQFTGYTGIQAVYGLVNLVYEWLTLETSNEVYELDDYYRCFRWLRWEAEKVYNIARYDPELTGNAWVERLIYELVEYMEMHHMNEFIKFEPNHIMDEYRNLFNDPSFDIEIILDKVKGIRKKVIETNKVNRHQKNK